MIPIEQMHDYIRMILQKNYGSFVSPGDIDKAIDRAQYDLLDEIIMNYDRKGMTFRDDNVFLVKASAAITTAGGNSVTLPADYYEMQNIFYRDGSNNEFEGELLKHDEFQDRRTSVIIPPILTEPIATIYGGVIEFFPAGDVNYQILYWKNPTTPAYAFTQTNGIITFDDANSVDLDWDQKDFSNISSRALKYLGYSIKDGQVISVEQNTNG